MARRLDESLGADLVSLSWYTVKSGDTIAGIAKKLRVTRADLSEANSLGTSSRLSAGQKLIVPPEASASARAAEQRVRTKSSGPRNHEGPAPVRQSSSKSSTKKKTAN